MRRIAFLPCMVLVLVLTGPAARSAESRPEGAWPLRPRPEVVRAFDPPSVAWGAGHRGVDLRGTIGQPVRATLPGRVSFVGRIAGVGIVVVDHGATRTTYQPVDGTVRAGAAVAAGTVLGALEWYGSHCLPATCLHWGLLQGDTYLDPLTLVGGPSPVRLLPLGTARPLPAGTSWAAPILPLPWLGGWP